MSPLKRAAYFVLILITAISPLLGLYGAPVVTNASANDGTASPLVNPEPLPRDCVGAAPPGDPIPACCIYGYIYYNNEPVTGAIVHVESVQGSADAVTTTGSDSTKPYYSAALGGAPLSVVPGDVITITAEYSGMSSRRTWVVQDDGQHVDLGLVTGYQAPEALASVGNQASRGDQAKQELYNQNSSLTSSSVNTPLSPPSVQFSAASYSVAENAGSATITATISVSAMQTVTVNYATSNGTAQAATDITWAARASIPTARSNAGVAVSSIGKIYVIGGSTGSTSNAVEEYDPTTNTWTARANLPTARYSLGATAANGKIYAIGGNTGGAPYVATVEE